ncbi:MULTISPECIES: hypothetical protein [Streptomyces]|uniref:hypothetical protein n=1 Tax=Streptomyces TaxID=1883 RepID=UPI0016783C40|nr:MULTISPECIES: hypothetical protein [Streptomyces]MBK3525773.1 hypothetical protein [Streptomyces sp. MBT70]GGS13782.1 hypothetical protein GCM10010236_80140 [Streptomyces eurythermus]
MQLSTDGFQALVAAAASRARDAALVADAVGIAVTLDGKVPEDVGRKALSLPEQVLLEAAELCGAGLTTADGGEELLVLSETGRLRVLADGSATPGGPGHVLGSVKWSGRPRSVTRLHALAEEHQRRQYAEVARWLADRPRAEVTARLDAIAHALLHMAPVRMYVGDRTFGNLGDDANLPGRSLAPGSDASVLTSLAAADVTAWSPEEATFVVCLHALISSGAPVRAEEFNGAQLDPEELAAFLGERIRAYGAPVPDCGALGIGARLELLADTCARARAELVRAGTVFYRRINGVSLHKREDMMPGPVGWSEVPAPLAEVLARHCGTPLTTGTDPEAALDAVARIPGALAERPAPAGFGSAYEAFLHEVFETVAESLGCDVAMGRGPRRTDGLGPATATRDCYCAVAPSRRFVRRFDGDSASLVRTLSAYSARMRYNTWHYLPHTMAWTEGRQPARDDWFFAPVMPDITDWSDRHHTGHVAFGVRHAIRVPLGIVLDGAYRPGLYDLRLLRTTDPQFELGDLRAAIAVGRVLECLHQAAAEAGVVVSDFDNAWYRAFHG